MLESRKLAIYILNEIEEILNAHNIKIPDPNRLENSDEACLFGCTYFELENKLTQMIELALNGEKNVSAN